MEILIRAANENDVKAIVDIGRIAVKEAHQNSCSEADMQQYIDANYNDAAILNELQEPANLYQLLFCDDKPAGFSKIVLNATHPNIEEVPATKLDRIYLLPNYFDLKLGYKLLSHVIELSKAKGQNCMWLFTWIGNERAISFYRKVGFEVIGEHSFKVTDTHYNPNHHMLLRY